MTKIAFLFLTISDINQPKIWEDYLSELPHHVSIYVHPKYPKQVSVPWMRENIIPKLVPTSWGYLTEAFYQLLQVAINNQENEHFIFISDSCIPISKLSTFYNYLKNHDSKVSFIHFKEEIDRYDWDKKIKKVPNYSNYELRKHEGLGNCLSRYHAMYLITKKKDFQRFFNQLNCGDEFYLSLIKEQQLIEDQQMTYYNWDYKDTLLANLNLQIDLIYKRAEKRVSQKLINRVKSLKKINSPSSKKKIRSLNKSIKLLHQNNNFHLLNESEKKLITKFRIQKSTLGKHPKEYNYVSQELIEKLQKSGFFFMRKISKHATIHPVNF